MILLKNIFTPGWEFPRRLDENTPVGPSWKYAGLGGFTEPIAMNQKTRTNCS